MVVFLLFVPLFFPVRDHTLFTAISCLFVAGFFVLLGSFSIFSLSFYVCMSYFPFPLWLLWTLCSHCVTFLGHFDIFVGNMHLFVVILSPLGALHLAVLIQHQFVADLCPLMSVLSMTFWHVCAVNLGLIL